MNDLQRETQVAEVLLNLAPKIIEQIHEGIVIVDEDMMIQFTNASVERIFKYHRSQMVGQHINMLLPEEYREAHTHHTESYIEYPHARAMGRGTPLYGLSRKGKKFPVEISLNPFSTPLGTFVVAVVHAKEASSLDAPT